jgi:hypothetical protein
MKEGRATQIGQGSQGDKRGIRKNRGYVIRSSKGEKRIRKLTSRSSLFILFGCPLLLLFQLLLICYEELLEGDRQQQ